MSSGLYKLYYILCELVILLLLLLPLFLLLLLLFTVALANECFRNIFSFSRKLSINVQCARIYDLLFVVAPISHRRLMCLMEKLKNPIALKCANIRICILRVSFSILPHEIRCSVMHGKHAYTFIHVF